MKSILFQKNTHVIWTTRNALFVIPINAHAWYTTWVSNMSIGRGQKLKALPQNSFQPLLFYDRVKYNTMLLLRLDNVWNIVFIKVFVMWVVSSMIITYRLFFPPRREIQSGQVSPEPIRLLRLSHHRPNKGGVRRWRCGRCVRATCRPSARPSPGGHKHLWITLRNLTCSLIRKGQHLHSEKT